MESEPVEFELGFRPASYFEDSVRLLANIKGDWRKQRVKEALESNEGSEVPEALFAEDVGDERRTFIGSIHPMMMGGEYLPDFIEHEVEIARVSLRSTTGDVISVRARLSASGIAYRVVDEYEAEGHEYIVSPTESERPLTMGELIELMDTARLHLEPEFGDGLIDPYRERALDGAVRWEDARDFVRVTSEYYPQLEAYYWTRGDDWIRGLEAALQAEDADEPAD